MIFVLLIFCTAAKSTITAHAGVRDQTVKIYVCPSDPSPKETLLATGYAIGNYQPSEDSFGRTAGGTQSIPQNFQDGTSNTILFGERYAVCGNPALNGSPIPYPPPGLPTACSPTITGGGAWANDVREWNYYQRLFGATGVSGGCDTALVLWQQLPTWNGTCNPYLYNSGHTGGMNVLLGDGSVRIVVPGMSALTWDYALQPNDGHPLGADW